MEALNRLLEIVNENGEKLGMRINAKTKVIIIEKDARDEVLWYGKWRHNRESG